MGVFTGLDELFVCGGMFSGSMAVGEVVGVFTGLDELFVCEGMFSLTVLRLGGDRVKVLWGVKHSSW